MVAGSATTVGSGTTTGGSIGTPTTAISGSTVFLRIPGKIGSGATFTPPALRFDVKATGAVGTQLPMKVRTSASAYKLTADVAGGIAVSCTANNPINTFTTTSITGGTTTTTTVTSTTTTAPPATTTETWTPTGPCGTVQTKVVPADTTSAALEAVGGKGGKGGDVAPATGASGRDGGRVMATTTPAPGSTISAIVGCAGANGSSSSGTGGAGFSGGGNGGYVGGGGGTGTSGGLALCAGGGGGGGGSSFVASATTAASFATADTASAKVTFTITTDPTDPTGDGSVYVSLVPCRILDTRNEGGALGNGATKAIQVTGHPTCVVPAKATAVEASVSAVEPTAGGFTRLWPTGALPPAATFVNYTKAQGTTNTGAISLGTGGQLALRNFGGPANYTLDIQGYFIEPGDLDSGVVGSVYHALVPCRVYDSRGADGMFTPNETTSRTVTGSSTTCGIASGATAAEASVSATEPASSSFTRLWPQGGSPATATFVNYTKAQGTTNTGSISLSTAGGVTLKNFGGTTHYVIDVQGYWKMPQVSS